MTVDIKPVNESDHATWAKLRHRLWPKASAETHLAELRTLVQRSQLSAWIATHDNVPVGFAEVSIRPYANGCEHMPVPFVEGIWVEDNYRKHGIGRRLMAAVEEWAKTQGFTELCSDAEQTNILSQNCHRSWGFDETERVVYFRKELRPACIEVCQTCL
jgi:aminoglycoside 6'-N-acetyltransferase I